MCGRFHPLRQAAEVPKMARVKGRASYGTTKYCFNFTKGQKCTNPDCLYLHHLANKEDCFTKEEMVTRQIEFYQITHPGGGSQWDERLQRYIYHKVSDEYVTSLPPPPRCAPRPRRVSVCGGCDA